MKINYQLLLISLLTITISSASAQKILQIKGVVLDSVSNQPLDYVTIGLKTLKNVAVKSTLTKNDGSFLISNLTAGKYTLTILAVSYRSKITPIDFTDSSKQMIDLGKIKLIADSKQLKEVIVSAERPIVKQEIDRITYDVQADPESKGQNMLDVMRKVPLLSMDAEDNPQLKGSANFKILINGRPSGLMARSPKDALESMQASNVQKIEVITMPSAKYDGEGVAGIINIITVKKLPEGISGLIGLGYASTFGGGGWINLTVKKGKFGFFGYTDRYFTKAPTSTFNTNRTGTSVDQSIFRQDGIKNNDGNVHFGNLEFSYEIDSLNLFVSSIGFNHRDNRLNNDQFFQILDQNGSMDKSYRLDDNGNLDIKGLDISLNYQLGFKSNKEKFFTASYKYTGADNNQNNQYLSRERINYGRDDLGQQNNAGATEQTIQLDYVQPGKVTNTELGAKLILRNNFSDFLYESFDWNTGLLIPGKSVSNEFSYSQNIFCAYNSYQFKLKKLGIKAGARFERTVMDAQRDYTNLLPSIVFQYKLKSSNSINAGYTQRIERPGINYLNPFINRSNPYFYSAGNPDLLPVLNHSFELSFSRLKKTSLIAGVSYIFNNNNIQNIVVLGSDSISRSSFQNIGRNDNLGLNLSFKYPITKKFTSNINARASYLSFNGFVNGNEYQRDGFQTYASTNFSYQFEKDWRVSLTVNTSSRSINIQGQTNGYLTNSLLINKNLFNKKAFLSLNIINPFMEYRRVVNHINNPGFSQESVSMIYSRGVTLKYVHNFGKLKEKIKKNKRGVSNDDLKKDSSDES